MKDILLSLRKYLPTILYSILGIVVLFILYKMVLRLKSGASVIGGVIVDKAENSSISKQTGVPVSKIKLIRQDVYSLAHDLNTLKGMTFWEKAKNVHLQFDSDTLKRFKNVKSEEEMSIFKNLYENEYTDNNDLLADLKDTLSSSSLLKVPFIQTIY